MARQEFGLKAAVIAGVAVVTATVVLVFGALTADRLRTANQQRETFWHLSGRLRLDRQATHGTRFHIRLPLLAPAATEEAAA